MQGRFAAKLCAAVLLAVVPSYLVERVTEYEFLTSSPAFFTWSGMRTELFISSILFAAMAAGLLVGKALPSAAAYTGGVVVLMFLFYYLCNSRVCYSTGIDGLEPLRMGYLFSCLGIVGTSIGSYGRTRERVSEAGGAERLILAIGLIGAIAYYPVVFAIAGTRLLPPLNPISVPLVVGLLSFVTAARVTASDGLRLGLATPVLANILLLAISSGIAKQYLPEILPQIVLILSIALVASIAGGLAVVLSGRSSTTPVSRHVIQSNKLVYAAVVLVLLMMVVFVPDAANANIPSSDGQSPIPQSFAFGVPAYAGGFMTQSFVRTDGVSVVTSFEGTNSSTIQDDNFLSAGIGAHSPHCCVDGLDFGYRFDAYLFHGGSEVLAASAWEVCDTVMACGGHSWQELLFQSEGRINASLSSSLHLIMEWKGRTLYWIFGSGQGSLQNFTSYNPPAQENAYFNAGTLGRIPASPEPPTSFHYGLPSDFDPAISTAALFFQYGMMSRYPIGHGGWSVTFTCPSVLDNGSWTCISHSESVQGDQAYWKALWRWGEPYANVVATADGAAPSVTFSYGPSSILENFQILW